MKNINTNDYVSYCNELYKVEATEEEYCYIIDPVDGSTIMAEWDEVEPAKKQKFDVEFQLKDYGIWVRINDNVAYTEDDAISMAKSKLKEKIGVDVDNCEGGYYVEIPNVEEPFENQYTFGDGYTYDDLVKSAAYGAIEGLEHLCTGIDNYMVMGATQIEFCTDLTGKQVLELFDKKEEEFKRDVVRFYVSERRRMRKVKRLN